jgi:hypothetical protein
MLLLRAEGLHSCAQMAWSRVRETVAEILSPSDGLILFCGISIGYEDPTVRYARTGRAPRRSWPRWWSRFSRAIRWSASGSSRMM